MKPTAAVIGASGRLTSLAVVLLSALAAASAHGEDVFTLAVAPDTQIEVSTPADTRFDNRMHWLIDNRAALNIKVFIQVGDLENWDTPDHSQYKKASAGLAILDQAKFPYILTLGNHDTAAVGGKDPAHPGGSAAPGDVHANLRNTATFNSFYPQSRFQLMQGVCESGKVDNAWHVFSAAGLDFLVINLECWARTSVVEWAKSIVAGHPHHNIIFVTHAHLNGSNGPQDGSDGIMQKNGGYGDNSCQYVFDQAMKPYANVRLVFCGHLPVHGYRKDVGANGNTIYQFNQTYHDNMTNPVRLFQIDVKAGTIKTWVHCPSIDQDKNDGSAFTVTGVTWVPAAAPDATSAPAITAQPANQTVALGHTATFTVASRGLPTPTYQWQRNNVNIGGATAASYTTSATLLGDTGESFRCVVSNSGGTVISTAATLTVTTAASAAPAPPAATTP